MKWLLILSFSILSCSAFGQSMAFRNVASFDKIEFEGWGNIFLIPGDKEQVEIKTKADLDISEVTTEVSGSTLYISYKKDEPVDVKIWKSEPKMDIHITYKYLEAISAIGVVNVATESPIVGARLHLHTEGTGKQNIEMEVEDLEVTVEGVTKMRLSGTAYSSDIEFEGVGKIWAEDLVTQNTIAEVNGTGNLYVNASDRLEAEANGFGAKIRYVGNPQKRNIEKSGFVSIRAIH